MELDFDKYCKLSESPNTVLPPPCRRSTTDQRKSSKRDISSKNNLFTLEESFTEINNYLGFQSISCKSVPSQISGHEQNEVRRRGSVYHSRHERTNIKDEEDSKNRKKIELSETDPIFSAFGILESLCSSDEESSISKNSLDFAFKENVASLERVNMDLSQCREASIGLHKSLSAKSARPQSPFHSDSDSSRPSSPKIKFDIKKMFDPFTKSKSTRKHDTFRKSLLSDFSKTKQVVKDVSRDSSVSYSPAHLQGFLKLETKHAKPFFEFSLNFPNDVLVSRRWKAENGLNWVYTFHSKDNKKSSSMVGQMQVSCYLRSNTKAQGTFNNFMETEFVLYDVKKPKDIDILIKKSMEIAAIIVQTPYEKRESLKHKGGDNTNLLDLCGTEEREKDLKLNVVVPLGTHGLPNADVASCGPSSLLERWRSNGECDCGGWDMACPLFVFGNRDVPSFYDSFALENQPLFELFVKGGKENTPALVITTIDEGCYTVDFHAKFSTLQAFSLCVAMLHCTETSITTAHDRENLLSKSDSLRVFVDEEIQDLVKAVKEEDKRTEIEKMGEKVPFSKIKPPFSPMSRV